MINNNCYVQRAEVNFQSLQQELRVVMEHFNSSEGCWRSPTAMDMVRRFDRLLDDYAHYNGVDKWRVLFQLIDLIGASEEDIYYFVTYFKTCLELNIITLQQMENLIHRYSSTYLY